jgi:hypothetical protein
MSKLIERKPRATCVLKGLAPDRQQALHEYMEGAGDEKGHTYAECLAWLQSSGVQTGVGNLSRWRTWYLQRLRFQWCHEITAMMVEDDRKAGQKYSDQDIQRKGNRLFNLLAIRTCDEKAWVRHQSLALRKQAIAAIERKMEFEMQKYADQRAKTKSPEPAPEMTPDEKQERIRQILGTE